MLGAERLRFPEGQSHEHVFLPERPVVAGQVGDGKGDPPGAVEAPGGQTPVTQPSLQETSGASAEGRHRLQLRWRHLRVAAHAPPFLGQSPSGFTRAATTDEVSSSGPPCHALTTTGPASTRAQKSLDVGSPDPDAQVEAVEQWPGDARDVPGASALSAAARPGGAVGAAAASVHGGDEHETGRESDGRTRPADDHSALLERLA